MDFNVTLNSITSFEEDMGELAMSYMTYKIGEF